MIKEAIEKILELARPPVVKVNGREYSTTNPVIKPVEPPLCEYLPIHTLSGFVDWVNSDKEPEPAIIRVVDESQVVAHGELDADWRTREIFVACGPFPYEDFDFNRFMSIEKFIIELQSKFEYTFDREKVIKAVSSISGSLVLTADDDGVAQTVTVTDSIGRLEETKTNPIVELAPFRTFRDIAQPASKFLLRLKKSEREGGLPLVALFEADGGAWRNDAIAGIKTYLEKAELGIDIIA